MAAATGTTDAPTPERITRLPPLPNPGSTRQNPAAAAEALQVLQQLSAGAANGTVDYPYPPTTSYPVPPLPPIPVPLGVKRYRPSPPKAVVPDLSPPIPPSSPLYGIEDAEEAVKAHNAAYGDKFVARYEFHGTTLLIRIGGGGWLRVVISGSDVLGVRFLPARSTSIPPVHAMPPSGPSIQITELFNSLHLNVPQILFRIPALFELLYEPCYYCRRRLNDTDGYPLGRIGWLPAAPKAVTPPNGHESEKEKAGDRADGEKKDGDKDGEKEGEKKEGETGIGEKKDAEKEGGKEEEKNESNRHEKMDVDESKSEGRWVCWHQSCQRW